jgi:sulfite reductase (ferredoxin)
VVAGGFKPLVMQINEHEPTESFAKQYYQQAVDFYRQAQEYRQSVAAAAQVNG